MTSWLITVILVNGNTHSELSQTSKMKLFVKMVNDLEALTVFAENSILDVLLVSEYIFVMCQCLQVCLSGKETLLSVFPLRQLYPLIWVSQKEILEMKSRTKRLKKYNQDSVISISLGHLLIISDKILHSCNAFVPGCWYVLLGGSSKQFIMPYACWQILSLSQHKNAWKIYKCVQIWGTRMKWIGTILVFLCKHSLDSTVQCKCFY